MHASCPEMEITKNKIPEARQYIFYRFLNPYPWAELGTKFVEVLKSVEPLSN
jgi:hypothetical protein